MGKQLEEARQELVRLHDYGTPEQKAQADVLIDLDNSVIDSINKFVNQPDFKQPK